MGLFDKVFKVNLTMVQILIVFAQAIESVEKNSKEALNEVWDIFINTVGFVADRKIISELEMEQVVYGSAFPENHSLTLDLVKIRDAGTSIQRFVDLNKRDFEIKWSPKGLGDINRLTPEYFAESLDSLAKRNFPHYLASKSDHYLIAAIAVFLLTIIRDSENYSNSNRTALRLVSYEFAIRWVAEWNHK